MKRKITLLNMLTGLLLQVCTIVSGFIIPKIILKYFGSEINGLFSSLSQFLSYATLLEGGITGVILAKLYKPLIEKDSAKLSAIIKTANNFYKSIGKVFILYAVALSIIYPLIFKTSYSFIFVCSLTLILAFGFFIQYVYTLTFTTLLNADKKNYVVSLFQSIIVILNVILAVLSVSVYPSIHLLKLISIILYTMQPIVYRIYVKKHYNLDEKVKSDGELIKERWNGFAINIAAFIHNSTDITILTIFTDLYTVSVYSVYSLITNGLKQLINSSISGINSTIGHAYAEGNLDNLNEKMDIYEYIVFLLVFFLFSVASLLITPFVMIYTSGVSDTSYYNPLFGILLIFSEALYLLKFPHLNLAYSANKFKEITKHAYIEAILNIVISIALVQKFEIIGVSIGTIIAMTYRMVFHVKFTQKIINNRKQSIFYFKLLTFTVTMIIGLLICLFLIPKIEFTIVSWLWHAIAYSLILGGMYFMLSVMFYRKELNFFAKYLKM